MGVGDHWHTLWPWIAPRGLLRVDRDIRDGGDRIRGRKSGTGDNHSYILPTQREWEDSEESMLLYRGSLAFTRRWFIRGQFPELFEPL